MNQYGKKAKELPSQDELRRLFDYDFETGRLVWRHREELSSQWNGRMVGKVAGSKQRSGHVRVEINDSMYMAHRIIWKLAYGTIPDTMQIDHVDGDPSNNKLDNLRLVTNTQNQLNRKADKGRKYKGVYKSRDKFKAEITTAEGRVFLGVYGTPEDAARAYNEAAKEHHGEYARLNEVIYEVGETV